MVHRTDIAGTVGRSRGRVDPGDDGSCRHAPSGARVMVLSSKEVIYRKPLPLRTSTARSAAVSSWRHFRRFMRSMSRPLARWSV